MKLVKTIAAVSALAVAGTAAVAGSPEPVEEPIVEEIVTGGLSVNPALIGLGLIAICALACDSDDGAAATTTN